MAARCRGEVACAWQLAVGEKSRMHGSTLFGRSGVCMAARCRGEVAYAWQLAVGEKWRMHGSSL